MTGVQTCALPIFTSGGLVGIGTSSPEALLTPYFSSTTAYSSTAINSGTASYQAQSFDAIAIDNVGANGFASIFFNVVSPTGYSGQRTARIMCVPDASASYGASIAFGNRDTSGVFAERLRIDSAGNLGLGVSPSAWGSGYKALELASTGAIASAGNVTGIYMNCYENSSGNYIRRTANYATAYVQNSGGSGQHQWWIAGSSTAGSTISFTQAMTLDASGNLGIGTTSISARLHVETSLSTQALFARTGNNAQFKIFQGATDSYLSATNASASLIFATQDTERARIDSSGDLLVGTTTAHNTRVAIK